MASNLFTELGCSNPIYPFVLLPEYRLIVCQPCQYACLAGETATHLSQKHADVDLGTRRRLTTEIKMIPNVLRSRTELPQLQYPPPTTEPISCLAPPKLDVLKCRQCNNFNVRQLQAMQEHYRKSHGWVNPRSIGRPAEGLSSTDNVPWIEGVACQRFFPSREGSRWFQVNFKTKRCNASALKAKRTPTKPQVAPRDLTSEGSTHLQQVMEREAGYQNALSQPCITGKNACRVTFASTSLWLDRTQWSSVYRGSRRDVLWAMTRPPNRHCLTMLFVLRRQGALDDTLNFVSPREDEQKISSIMGAFDSVIDRCENTVRSTSHNTLCWLLSSRLQSRRESPFALVAEKNSEVRYRRTQKQFLAFVFRLYRMASGVRQDVTEAKVRPEIYAELDRIWNHNIWCLFEISKGTWPAIERQEDNPTGPSPTTSGVLSINDASDATVHDDRRTCATESEEDEEGGNADVEDWDPDEDDDNDDDSEDDDSEDENDCDDSGYWSNIDGPSATPYREMSAGVLRGSTKVVFDEFLEILFQLCVTLCTETFVDGQPSSTLLVYFSGVLGFSADCHRFQLARQYCPKLSAIIYMQRILLLELALPMREYTTIGIPQRPRAAQFESLNRIRAKYMVLGSQYPLAELVSLLYQLARVLGPIPVFVARALTPFRLFPIR
ncbi:uncharacterized protein BKA55DRAFT_514321 [Fusarium redolens]|uniref:Uncharacterized protein n=1 Tax=Fusarium redolens TaxID=48865 RepID=A0A9P9H087_FUSRE|nr:uncharacterized protein BKA55DRAFT_514321 [Fusarium redolens]KAH7247477.1 hypothetical protein BKA55DRAFT_514321 [Fusarium redolens]